jgi:hypothetical protein
MALNVNNVLGSVEAALAVQQIELAEGRARQLQAVAIKTGTGTVDIDQTFKLDQKFRLVFVRCHFTGTSGSADFTISVDSANGTAYDTKLFTVIDAGTTKDVHLRIGLGDTGEPSAWTFQSGDSVRIQWTNPDSGNISWGVEIGLAPAS